MLLRPNITLMICDVRPNQSEKGYDDTFSGSKDGTAWTEGVPPEWLVTRCNFFSNTVRRMQRFAHSRGSGMHSKQPLFEAGPPKGTPDPGTAIPV